MTEEVLFFSIRGEEGGQWGVLGTPKKSAEDGGGGRPSGEPRAQSVVLNFVEKRSCDRSLRFCGQWEFSGPQWSGQSVRSNFFERIEAMTNEIAEQELLNVNPYLRQIVSRFSYGG